MVISFSFAPMKICRKNIPLLFSTWKMFVFLLLPIIFWTCEFYYTLYHQSEIQATRSFGHQFSQRHASIGCTSDCQSLTSNLTQKYHQTNNTIKLPKFPFNCTSHATHGQHDPFLVRTTTSPWPTSCKKFQFHTPSQPFDSIFLRDVCINELPPIVMFMDRTFNYFDFFRADAQWF